MDTEFESHMKAVDNFDFEDYWNADTSDIDFPEDILEVQELKSTVSKQCIFRVLMIRDGEPRFQTMIPADPIMDEALNWSCRLENNFEIHSLIAHWRDEKGRCICWENGIPVPIHNDCLKGIGWPKVKITFITPKGERFIKCYDLGDVWTSLEHANPELYDRLESMDIIGVNDVWDHEPYEGDEFEEGEDDE